MLYVLVLYTLILAVDRTFPCEPPGEKISNTHNLLRPELVQLSSIPLSSDSFSELGIMDSHIHNNEVLDIVNRLKYRIIPQFAATYSKKDISHVKRNLCQLMHNSGINLRHLGLLRSSAKNIRFKSVLLDEMVARVVKNMIRFDLRQIWKKYSVLPSQAPFREIIIQHLNKLVSLDDGYWKEVKTQIINKFEGALVGVELEDTWNMRSYCSIHFILERIQHFIGFKLTEASVREYYILFI